MIWVDREAKKLQERKKEREWVDDMKTPSGRIHVGSLRGVVIHDLVYKALREQDVNVEFTYVFNDHDPMDAIPSYLNYSEWQKYEGVPLYKIPSPEPGYDSFARFYALEFQRVFESLNCHPRIVWSSELYNSGKMNDVIVKILNAADKVRDIYKRVAHAHRADDWYPFQVNCERCGKVGTTHVYRWDGKHVYYRCQPHLVKWAKGCGYEGKISPLNGNGKLVWKLDWPATWYMLGVTIEGSGKDHMSSGGSYDMASAICKEVLGIEPPYPVPYEWFTIGGRKMSSSKGIGSSAKEIAALLPPEVLRFLIVRTPIQTHLDFDPSKPDTISNLFDDFDRCMDAYFLKQEGKLPDGKQGEVLSDFARIMELSAVRPLPEKRIYLPRFRTILNIVRVKGDVLEYAKKQKGSSLNDEEQDVLEERVVYAEKYLGDISHLHKMETRHHHSPRPILPVFAPDELRFLNLLYVLLKKIKELNLDTLKHAVFTAITESKLPPRKAFRSFYLAMIGKEYGPHANELILEVGLKKTFELLTAVSHKQGAPTPKASYLFPRISDSSIFSIDPLVKKTYPSITIGLAILKGVTIGKTSKKLQQEIAEFIQTQRTLTTEQIGAYPEVKSYRRLYKEMRVDWHSRRPSPEALLRRIATKKGLYNVNSCVDAYNLIVMKHRVSVGAFDLDRIQFPTVLRFPNSGDKILLLGDKEPTEYKTTELAYFDRDGGYNIDFNYRDAKRTAVYETTKNILLNVDGVYDVTREKVERSLSESIEIILTYCGGKVEMAGIV